MTTHLTEVRPARPEDAEALSGIHAAAWRGAYRGLLDGIDLERLVSRRTPSWWCDALTKGVLIEVLEIGGEAAGYASYGSCRMPALRCDGEIYEIYLKPECQGLGFGRQLFETARKALQSRGLNGLAVRVLSDNGPACAFYRALGGRLAARTWHETGGRRLELSVFVWAARRV
ncbi:GNAT family N-acetyltransferase [Polymorphum gilvum]|uniref:Acetyltransferase, GNAT family n=1 Tax=Polymorphum gilvum (strain LMG 25793 / CGMCC 1.9160 / SL003B-26A1) TaxID=991905 RepID=F2J303_POLGS|nr:GNAT family N-acetyltransferase [Polymorphum gilvum]ADZ68873.1 Acetyltransferase, GNAT family [Polymorphum gilvum SL003B-26A1]